MKVTNCEKKKANVEIGVREEEKCITTHNFHKGGSQLLQWRWNQVCQSTKQTDLEVHKKEGLVG